MNSFTEDLVSFFRAIEQWLQTFRSILAGDLGPETASFTDSEAPSVSATLRPSITNFGPVAVLTIVPAISPASQSSLCRPAAGAGPLVPCSEDSTTSFTTIRSTSRKSDIVTSYATASYLNATVAAPGTAVTIPPSAVPYPVLNISSPTAPGRPSVQYISTTTPITDVEGNTYTSTFTSYSISPTPSPYLFNATSQDNAAVYYGSTSRTTIGGLLALCADPNVDIVILSSIHDSSSPTTNYPTLDFGPGCIAPTSAQQATAPGLKDCSALAPQLAACQSLGKKVLVGLGGARVNSSSFASATHAAQFATTLWRLFGGGPIDADVDPALRPFGPSRALAVDGFDIATEDPAAEYYDVFASALRAHFASDPGKTYYLSAAPACGAISSSSSSTAAAGLLAAVDFVWPRFYNDAACALDTSTFQTSFAAWSRGVARVAPAARLFVGVPAFAQGGDGYVEGAALYTRITQARGLDVGNLGGIMLWDGTEAGANVDRYGVDYLGYAKDALHL